MLVQSEKKKIEAICSLISNIVKLEIPVQHIQRLLFKHYFKVQKLFDY